MWPLCVCGLFILCVVDVASVCVCLVCVFVGLAMWPLIVCVAFDCVMWLCGL
jgi:hypothetical protein